MSKEKIEKLEPVCEGCEDGACNIDFDTPTSYKEAYEALKKEYDRLEIGLEHADNIIKEKDHYIDRLKDNLNYNARITTIALKTLKTIKNNIEIVDESLRCIDLLESELKILNKGEKYYE